jgi:hypothetical protein
MAGLLAMACGYVVANPSSTPASTATVIYKHIDENGRVTYANSPIKGGVRVELEPLTVIPSTPSGSLGQSPHNNAVTPPPAPLLIPVAAQGATNSVPAIPGAPGNATDATPRVSGAAAGAATLAVAKVVPVGFKPPNEKIEVKRPPSTAIAEGDDGPVFPPRATSGWTVLTPSNTPNPLAATATGAGTPIPLPERTPQDSSAPFTALATVDTKPEPAPETKAPSAFVAVPPKPLQLAATLSPEAMQKITEQRRLETRRRVLEGEAGNEEQMLVQARLALVEAQRQTQTYRALRAAPGNSAEAGAPLSLSKSKREEIERHFERVRNLQDQVALHEAHLKALRDQLGKLN